MEKTCSIEGCARRIKGLGLCGLHYRRKRDLGDPLAPLKKAAAGTYTTCTVAGCEKPNEAKGLCPQHRWRLRQHGDVLADVPAHKHVRTKPKREVWPDCKVDGCERNSREGAKGYCRRHYERVKKTGDPGPAGRLTATPGTGHTHLRTGYRMIQVDGKQVKEHRHVIEQQLGRPLLPDENVHHKNGDRADNRIENLELWSTMQPTGKRAEDLLAYADEIYRRYGSVRSRVTEG